MCHHRVCIAKLDENRYVTVCQHKVVHAHWDNLTLSWRDNEFRRFVKIIKHQLQTQVIPEPSVVLQVNQVFAGWPTADFYQFADMVVMGLIYLDVGLEHLAKCEAQSKQVQRPYFSLN